MRLGISGLACVTPLGATPGEVLRRIAAGETAKPDAGATFAAALVPEEFSAHLAREPRLRRSSAISLFAAAAGKAALAASGLRPGVNPDTRLAIVLGVSSGGVRYTRRFYEQIVKEGANAASPLLFPETVYNAPASHLAAMLGVDGATYTIVGDGTVGLQALHFGGQLLATGEATHALVVAAEETDWVLVEAHRVWRLTAEERVGRRGALLAEGAAAVVIGAGRCRVTARVSGGATSFSRRDASSALGSVLSPLAEFAPVDLVVSGRNGTWTDRIIETEITRHFPGAKAPWIDPMLATGAILGAGGLLEVVLAAQALEESTGRRALVATLGWNQQAAAAIVEREAGS